MRHNLQLSKANVLKVASYFSISLSSAVQLSRQGWDPDGLGTARIVCTSLSFLSPRGVRGCSFFHLKTYGSLGFLRRREYLSNCLKYHLELSVVFFL